VIMIVEKN